MSLSLVVVVVVVVVDVDDGVAVVAATAFRCCDILHPPTHPPHLVLLSVNSTPLLALPVLT